MSKVILEVNNIPFTGFKSMTVTRSIDTGTGTFGFVTTPGQDDMFPIDVEQKCIVKLEDQAVLTGFIEQRRIGNTNDANPFNISGRGRINDIIDSNVVGVLTFTGGISLKEIATRIIANVQADLKPSERIQVIDGSGGIDNFDESEIEALTVETKAFAFIEKLAKKRQVLLTTDGKGDLILTRGLGRIIKTHLISIKGDPDNKNNILASAVDKNHSQRFHRYIVKSQDNFAADSAPGTSTTGELATNREGESIDNAIRRSRTLVINAESASDDFTSEQRAIWKQNFLRANSLT